MSRQGVAIFGLFWVLLNYIYYTIFQCRRVKKADKKGYSIVGNNLETKWIQNGNKLDTQYSKDKNSIDKYSIDKKSKEYIEQKQ